MQETKDRFPQRTMGGRTLWVAIAVAAGVHVVAGVLADRYLSRVPAWSPATEFGEVGVSLTLIPETPPPAPAAPAWPPDPVPMPIPDPAPESMLVFDRPLPNPVAMAPTSVPVAEIRPPSEIREIQTPPLRESAHDPLAFSTPSADLPTLLAPQSVPHEAPRLAGGAVRIQPRYPFVSRLRGEQGSVTIRAWISSDGRIGDAEIVKSSGFASLDEAAIVAVRDARFAMPPDAEGRTEITVPIVFQLTN